MSTIVIGLSLGMLLFLLAAGLTLIFGMLGVINFAHGAIYMLGAYVSYETGRRTGSFLMGVLAATFFTALAGAVIEKLALRPLYERPHFYQLILTFGLILILSDVVRFVWGPGYQEVAIPPLWNGTVDMLGSTIPMYRLFVIGF
ncbi:MAG: branched-chain amino acid ABC transporter permease, partial [Deinococcota bacterium]